jgi:hypothetical protein
MLDVVIVTTRPLPEPDPDEGILVQALRDSGLAVELHPWKEGLPPVARLALIRSPWDYHDDLPGFLNWCQQVSSVTTLKNPLSVVRWNAHKQYLVELRLSGVPVVPTAFLPRDESERLELFLANAFSLYGPDLICKPAVSAGSYNTWRVTAADAPEFAARILAERDLMVQPYLSSVESTPERSLVFIGGQYSHTMHKQPRLTGDDERVTGPHPVADSDMAVALLALSLIPERVLYARVDLITDMRGQSVLSELELLEPSLFLAQHPPALRTLVKATHRLCRS